MCFFLVGDKREFLKSNHEKNRQNERHQQQQQESESEGSVTDYESEEDDNSSSSISSESDNDNNDNMNVENNDSRIFYGPDKAGYVQFTDAIVLDPLQEEPYTHNGAVIIMDDEIDEGENKVFLGTESIAELVKRCRLLYVGLSDNKAFRFIVSDCFMRILKMDESVISAKELCKLHYKTHVYKEDIKLKKLHRSSKKKQKNDTDTFPLTDQLWNDVNTQEADDDENNTNNHKVYENTNNIIIEPVTNKIEEEEPILKTGCEWEYHFYEGPGNEGNCLFSCDDCVTGIFKNEAEKITLLEFAAFYHDFPEIHPLPLHLEEAYHKCSEEEYKIAHDKMNKIHNTVVEKHVSIELSKNEEFEDDRYKFDEDDDGCSSSNNADSMNIDEIKDDSNNDTTLATCADWWVRFFSASLIPECVDGEDTTPVSIEAFAHYLNERSLFTVNWDIKLKNALTHYQQTHQQDYIDAESLSHFQQSVSSSIQPASQSNAHVSKFTSIDKIKRFKIKDEAFTTYLVNCEIESFMLYTERKQKDNICRLLDQDNHVAYIHENKVNLHGSGFLTNDFSFNEHRITTLIGDKTLITYGNSTPLFTVGEFLISKEEFVSIQKHIKERYDGYVLHESLCVEALSVSEFIENLPDINVKKQKWFVFSKPNTLYANIGDLKNMKQCIKEQLKKPVKNNCWIQKADMKIEENQLALVKYDKQCNQYVFSSSIMYVVLAKQKVLSPHAELIWYDNRA